MRLDEEFNELQRLFAQKDVITEQRRSKGNGPLDIRLMKKKQMKIKIYQEKGHYLPHIHIDYGRQQHTASYAIGSGERIEGSLSKNMTLVSLVS